MKVKLEDIIEAMEFANMETEYYYDTHNEKVLMLFDGMVDTYTSTSVVSAKTRITTISVLPIPASAFLPNI